jgi:hypothetical protein
VNVRTYGVREALRKYWAGLDWVEELLYLSALATEAAIIYPWQLLAHSALGHRALPYWGLCVLLWAAYGIVTLLDRISLSAGRRLTADRKQALVVALILVCALLVIRVHVYAPRARGEAPWDFTWVADMVDGLFSTMSSTSESALPPDLLALLVVLVAWWRGIVASRKELDIQQVWFRFRLGVVLLLGFFLISIVGRRQDLTGVVFAFFFFGLLSIALSRILELGGIHQSTLGSRQWVGLLAGAVLGNLALALLASLLFSRQVIATVLGWLRPLFRLVQVVLWLLVSIMAYLLVPLLMHLLSFIRQIDPGGLAFLTSPLFSPLATPEEIAEQGELANWVPVCRTVTTLLIIVGGLFLVTLAVRRLARQREKDSQDERESLWSDQDLLGDLRHALQRGLDRLRSLGQGGDRKRRSAESIRKMYASVVDLADEAGYPRGPAETPYEHRYILYQAFPGGEAAVDAITEAYVRVHYGEVPDTEEEMDQLRRYWREMQGLVTPKATGLEGP